MREPRKLRRLRAELRRLGEQAQALGIINDGLALGLKNEAEVSDYEKARALVHAVRREMAGYLEKRRIMSAAVLTLLLLTG